MHLRLALIVFVLICITGTHAQMYVCEDKDGNKIYSDNPNAETCVKVEKINPDSLPPLIESKPLVYPGTNKNTSNSNASAATAYSSISITSPTSDENLRSNEGDVNISYHSVPPLQAHVGHKYVVSIGDKEIYTGTNNVVALKNVDRGTHILSAKIVSAKGKTLISSASVQFTLHRHSILQGNQAPPTPAPLPSPGNGGGNPGGGQAPGGGISTSGG